MFQRTPTQLYRSKRGVQNHQANSKRTARTKLFLILGVPLLAIIGTLMNFLLLNLNDLGFGMGAGMEEESRLVDIVPPSKVHVSEQEPSLSSQSNSDSIRKAPSTSSSSSNSEWCQQVAAARFHVSDFLQIHYPCESLQPATSAIVCMLTDGAADGKATKVVFTARDYINGVMTLGKSLQGNIDPSQTHQLLLLREGFELAADDVIRLQSVGWTIGTAPNFPLQTKFIPRFPRYKTTYTKVTAIGMEEYKCVMLIDADALVVGDIRDVMQCDGVFKHPNNRVAGVLDWYQEKRWRLVNTGSILWKTSGQEMDRVFNLTKDDSFMKKFSSDQEFLNHVYPDRMHNNTLNSEIVDLDTAEIRGGSPVIPHAEASKGAVVPLSWDYNAQTHAEVHNQEFWKSHRDSVKILHFTQKKGWQCERRTEEPPPLDETQKKCPIEEPMCFCREAHLYWRKFEEAETTADKSLALAQKR
ncbi:MAG: hypothetical protein SGILL_006584 [Bacillariaceae sp.]